MPRQLNSALPGSSARRGPSRPTQGGCGIDNMLMASAGAPTRPSRRRRIGTAICRTFPVLTPACRRIRSARRRCFSITAASGAVDQLIVRRRRWSSASNPFRRVADDVCEGFRWVLRSSATGLSVDQLSEYVCVTCVSRGLLHEVREVTTADRVGLLVNADANGVEIGRCDNVVDAHPRRR